MFLVLYCFIFLGGASVSYADTWHRIESPHFIAFSANNASATRAYVEKLENFNDVTDVIFDQIGDSEIQENHKYIFYYLGSFDDFKVIRPDIADLDFNPALGC